MAGEDPNFDSADGKSGKKIEAKLALRTSNFLAKFDVNRWVELDLLEGNSDKVALLPLRLLGFEW